MHGYRFKVIDNESGESMEHYALTGGHEGESTRSRSSILESGESLASESSEGEDIYE